MNRTVRRAFQVLKYVAKEEDGLTLTEITELLDCPKSSAFNIIQTLLNLDLLSESKANNKKYQLGPENYVLGMNYYKRLDLVDLFKEFLPGIGDKLHRNCFGGILEGDKVLYIYKYAGEGAKLATCDKGTKAELYCTGLGKVLLAYSSSDYQKKVIDSMTFIKKTERTISTKEQLYKELEEVRKKGYACDNCEIEDYMICFAAPVFNFSGECVAAVSISDMYTESTDCEFLGQQIRNVALEISKRIGYNR